MLWQVLVLTSDVPRLVIGGPGCCPDELGPDPVARRPLPGIDRLTALVVTVGMVGREP